MIQSFYHKCTIGAIFILFHVSVSAQSTEVEFGYHLKIGKLSYEWVDDIENEEKFKVRDIGFFLSLGKQIDSTFYVKGQLATHDISRYIDNQIGLGSIEQNELRLELLLEWQKSFPDDTYLIINSGPSIGKVIWTEESLSSKNLRLGGTINIGMKKLLHPHIGFKSLVGYKHNFSMPYDEFGPSVGINAFTISTSLVYLIGID